jgi:hypothetical protein
MKEERESPFTGAGKILFLATVIPACGGIAYVLLCIFPNLPPGSYPIFYLFGPVFIGAALFFFGVAAFLRKRGIAVLVSEKEEVEQMKKDRNAIKTVKK